ncbi:MAG: alcohol dehydrogenase catalytic domain-containing protein [Leadbetterella sp.]|nr:alcohol dehydrogenase catalytic domain-containing protein [Leadbetterella sp.]
MKAVVYKQYGPPEVAKLQELEKPRPKENEILIKVYATTVNRTDSGFRSAEYFVSRFWSGLIRPKLQVLGCEFAGIVEETGPGVTLFKAGDKVFGYDDGHFGGHAEYKVIAENGPVAHLPENLDFYEAAPATEGSHYALYSIRAAGVEPGQNGAGVRSHGSHRLSGGSAAEAFRSAGYRRMQYQKCVVTKISRRRQRH